jgi:hypothetical protein
MSSQVSHSRRTELAEQCDNTTAQQYTDSMSRSVHFKSVNPFEVLSSVDVTDGNGKNSSVGSSDSLVSLKDAEVAVSTPVRGQTRAFSHSAGQYQVSTRVLARNDVQPYS